MKTKNHPKPQEQTMNPHRKQLRLKNYDYRWNGAYFITIASHHRQKLFQGPNPCLDQIIQETYQHIETTYPYCQVIEQTTMPDHLHFLLMIDGPEKIEHRQPLPTIIKNFKGYLSNQYIKKVKQGKLPPFHEKIWQKGYYERVLRSEEEVYQVRKYIQENPLKLALLKEE